MERPDPSILTKASKALVAVTGGGRTQDWSVQGRLEGAVGAALFSLLPSVLYAVTTLGLPSDLKHLWSLLLLGFGPLLMLTTMRVSAKTDALLTC